MWLNIPNSQLTKWQNFIRWPPPPFPPQKIFLFESRLKVLFWSNHIDSIYTFSFNFNAGSWCIELVTSFVQLVRCLNYESENLQMKLTQTIKKRNPKAHLHWENCGNRYLCTTNIHVFELECLIWVPHWFAVMQTQKNSLQYTPMLGEIGAFLLCLKKVKKTKQVTYDVNCLAKRQKDIVLGGMEFTC